MSEKGEVEHQCSPLCFMTAAVSHSSCRAFPAMVDCNLKLWATVDYNLKLRAKTSFLPFSAVAGSFVTEMEK